MKSAPARRGAGELWASGILVAGLSLAAWLYIADPLAQEKGPGRYELELGGTQATSEWDSRAYRRSLEYFSGKQGIFFAEVREWFGGIFQGAPLAIIVAGLTLAGAAITLHSTRGKE
ncbi:MAG TPA: hypothetical protein VN419_09490 [Humidesulfovibrio sp.]|uniref:hypothetical protein n=1 Tax=Humidesulfovibrio sp. TaxID=2910988 RepID=UPI002B5F4C3E|nr:hypothetical protein [Humidesulfovibrio sp.]HWR04241.1 hypothetical protein [Humidesulfovibrio sp.]